MASLNIMNFFQGLLAGMLTTLIFINFNMGAYKSAYQVISRTVEQQLVENMANQAEDFQLLNDEHAHRDDDSVARQLKDQIRVLVGIITSPDNIEKRTQSVKDTWAKRCNKIVYFSTEENKEFPTVGLNVSEGYKYLTAKTIATFQYIYDHYFNEFDWFMKADDDTYVIMENLRYFLSSQNTSEPVYFGHHFRPLVKQGYHGGGAGYVLSKEALRRFGEKVNNSECLKQYWAEDVQVGRCLESLGVRINNATDSLGRSRFHSFTPEVQLSGNFPNWYYSYDTLGSKKGEASISDYAISFHKITPLQMRHLDFYVYHLRPYGIYNGKQSLNVDRTSS